MPKIIPCILSGGSGTRLWPVSRRMYPKQFTNLLDDRSLFQHTVARFSSAEFEPPVIIGNHDHRFVIGDQLAQIGRSAREIVLEPEGRNTAAAAAIATLLVERDDPDGLVLLAPSDHLIAHTARFVDDVKEGARRAADGAIVTFGVAPAYAHTGYGYLRVEGRGEGAVEVASFVEKPSADLAEQYVSSGQYLWNAGIFLFSPDTMRRAFETHAPEILDHCAEALKASVRDLDFLRLDAAAYRANPTVSIDRAIMEKVSNIVCQEIDVGWRDLGSWSSYWETLAKDGEGNAGRGEVVFEACRNSYAYAEDVMISAVGLENIFVVATADAVLVCANDRAESVKPLIDKINAVNRSRAEHHRRVHRPWGWYETLGEGGNFKAKLIMIKPGAKLSLQKHEHRAEHWVVLEGALDATVGENVTRLHANQSTYIAAGQVHRIANTLSTPGYVVEIQTGDLLVEEDIERYEDDYNRS